MSRRDWLRIGALGLGGLTLPGLLHLERAHADGARPRARSVIVLFLSGGPSHLDMWDPKPDAPEEIRGTFQPIATRVPGIRLSEHLPGTAAVMDRCCVVAGRPACLRCRRRARSCPRPATAGISSASRRCWRDGAWKPGFASSTLL
jgi:hypothetical protein